MEDGERTDEGVLQGISTLLRFVAWDGEAGGYESALIGASDALDRLRDRMHERAKLLGAAPQGVAE